MKRTLTVLVIVLSMILCSACGNSKKENDMIQYETSNFYDENWSQTNENDMIQYKTGSFHDKNWNETIGTYSGKAVVPDKETALKIAKAIFDGMEKSKEMQDYVPRSVFYDNQDEVWIVSFAKKPEQLFVTVGGDCSIALQKKDGKVLRIWFGE